MLYVYVYIAMRAQEYITERQFQLLLKHIDPNLTDLQMVQLYLNIFSYHPITSQGGENGGKILFKKIQNNNNEISILLTSPNFAHLLQHAGYIKLNTLGSGNEAYLKLSSIFTSLSASAADSDRSSSNAGAGGLLQQNWREIENKLSYRLPQGLQNDLVKSFKQELLLSSRESGDTFRGILLLRELRLAGKYIYIYIYI